MNSDPIRLLDDPQLAASLRADLAHASAVTVEGLDTTAGVAGLKAAIAAETAAASSAAGGASVLGKIAIAVLLVGGGAAAVWATTRNTAEPEPPVKAAATVSEEPAVARRAPDREQPEPAIVPAVEAEPEPELAPEAEPTPEEEDAADVEPKLQRSRATKSGKPATSADATDRVLREARMIADAREALAARPSEALSLAQQAAREFPRGQLIEEREAIAIRALAKLGRTEAARTRAERFLSRYGTGPHAESVRHAIGATAQ